MPGPVSDSYDPEWGTGAKAADIDAALRHVYACVTEILDGAPPMDIRHLVDIELTRRITANLSEHEWRMLRFAVERARESL